MKEKNEIRQALVSKRLTIAECVRQTGASRVAVKRFKETGLINPATFARIAAKLVLPEIKKRKGE